jgi:hypothetical protein
MTGGSRMIGFIAQADEWIPAFAGMTDVNGIKDV